MNRKDFLKSLVGLALAPLAIRQIAKEESRVSVKDEKNTVIYKVNTALLPSNTALEEFLYYWKNHGVVINRTSLI